MSTTVDLTPERQAVLDKFRDELQSGVVFMRAAQAHRTNSFMAGVYRPPIGHRDWAHCYITIGRMARESDALAQVAASIVGKINLYGTDPDVMAHVYEGAAKAVTHGFDDVIGRTGPNAGRPSSYHRAFTLYEVVAIGYWLEFACRPFAKSAPGVGWCLSMLADECHARVDHVDDGSRR